MSRAYWKTVRLRLGTEISYWSCLPIPNLPLSCPPPPPPLWDHKSLFCWFLLFFICSPLPRSFPGSLFQQTPLFVPYKHTSVFYVFSPLLPRTSLPWFWSVLSLSLNSDWLTFSFSSYTITSISLPTYHSFEFCFLSHPLPSLNPVLLPFSLVLFSSTSDSFFSIALFLFLIFASFLSAASILQSAAHTSYNLKERHSKRKREREMERDRAEG